MKKILAVLMVVVTVATMFTGCLPEPNLKPMCDWLQDNGFTAGLGELGFGDRISAFTYEGRPLEQSSELRDVEGGIGHIVTTDVWEWLHEETENNTRLNNNFTITANLDNLELPCGVKVGDSKDDCIEKLGLKGKRTNITGLKAGRGTCDLTVTDTIITFKEHYDWFNDAGQKVQVTRALIFKFVDNNLMEFGITITEKSK